MVTSTMAIIAPTVAPAAKPPLAREEAGGCDNAAGAAVVDAVVDDPDMVVMECVVVVGRLIELWEEDVVVEDGDLVV